MPLVSKAFGDIITFTRASSATFTGSNGLIQSATTNTPRFDYDPVTLAAKGLLIEEQRTNLLTYSEDFSNAAWTKTTCVVTSNAITAPDGTVTGDKIVVDTGVTQGNVLQAPTYTANVANAGSVFVKAGEWGWVVIEVRGTDGVARQVWFNVTSGTVGTANNSATGTITNCGNGWYRCVATATLPSGASTTRFRVYPTNADNTFSTGDGTSGIYAWGAQAEVGAFATSYIPTVASQVTRSADVASVNTMSPWYNATEGTLYAESLVFALTNQRIVSFNDGTATNRIILSRGSGSGGNVNATVTNGGSTQVNGIVFGASLPVTTTIKAAFAYKQDDFAGSVNGGVAVTDTSGTIPTVNILALGSGETLGTNVLNGYLRRITYYPRRLSNAELQAITA